MIEDIDKKFEQLTHNNLQISKFEPLNLQDLISMEFTDINWIVDNLIPANGITIISGAPSSGKTWLIYEIALSVALGLPLFNNFTTEKANVLIIDEEMGLKSIKDRMQKLIVNFPDNIFINSHKGFIVSPENINSLIRICKKHQIQVVIFDSLIRIAGLNDENSSVETHRVFNLLKEFAKNDITILLTHHNRKGSVNKSKSSIDDMRGSSDISANIDSHLSVTKKDNEITISQPKSRHEEAIQEFTVKITSDETNQSIHFDYSGIVNKENTNKKDEAKDVICGLLSLEEKPLYQKEIIKRLRLGGTDIGINSIQEALTDLVREGTLQTSKGKGKQVFYSLMNKVEEPLLEEIIKV